MNILIVTAHFPPNFVGGGSVVPRHLATQLRRRGHDVNVFTGWRGDERGPLEESVEVDEEGVNLHWVNTTPWLSDLDDRQYDNPGVTDLFAAYLDRLCPDVVNFHSLQGIGAGVIDAAAARGLPTALVMHDFWWWCGRMFMSDRSGEPCCPVVDCGVCECSVDAAWLAGRNRRLQRSLAKIDKVICVSRTLADFARANGVDQRQLTVIENGVPEAESLVGYREGPVADASASLRFVYAGGPDPRKGPYVLAEAVKGLKDLTGWSLTAYGWPDDAGIPGDAASPVFPRPPFQPTGVGAALREADVVVVPSVMRESYSILARQALTLGVPVLTTDCLGPEEVVVDGVNGLVVPSADPAALGGAMRRLVTDPALVPALRANAATPAIRTIEDAAADYEKLLSEVVSSRPMRNELGSETPIKRVCFIVGITGAPLRYRAYLPSEALGGLGVECNVRHYRNPDVDRLAVDADIVVLYRVPATIQVVNLVSGLRARGIPTVFDVDDLIFDPAIGDEIPAVQILNKAESDQWMEGVRRYRATLDLCDAFIGSTTMLAEHAEAQTGLSSYRFANGVGRLVGRLSDAAYRTARTPGPLRIGYLSGTNTHDYDWQHIEPAVARVMDEHPDLELWLVGLIEPTDALHRHAARIVRRPLVHWTELPVLLGDLDVNLAPLAPGWRFNHAKSAIKWLEAALVGTVTVASPTEPFREVIDHGTTGLLAETEEEWQSAIEGLVRDGALRRACGDRARRSALLDLSPAVQGPRYLEILRSVRSNPEPRSKTDLWRAITDDEPSAPFDLDRYAPLDDEPAGSRPVTMRTRVQDTVVTLREQGVAPAAARAARYGARVVRGQLRRPR